LHGLTCPCCATVTRAELPLGVSALGYGERLTAMVALLSGAYRLSYISDRYSAYRWIEVSRWQVCWVHLKPDFTAMAERRGVKPVGRLG
jgi:hypothetical protein